MSKELIARVLSKKASSHTQVLELCGAFSALIAAGDRLAGFAGHEDECRAVLAAWGEVEACSCGYADAWQAWRKETGHE